MDNNLIAKAAVTIEASRPAVWDALVDPQAIGQYMFDTNVVTNWEEGSSIVWRGEWQGKKYEDKGVLTQIRPEKVLQYTHYSPLSGLPDKPENYHTVTIELYGNGDQTHVSLKQDNNSTEEEREHSEKNWKTMLDELKKYLEN